MPKASPSKSSQSSFPPGRLRNGVAKASTEELEESSEICEAWAWRCAWILIFGLTVELALALAEPPRDSFWSRWGSSLATSIVVLGVFGEVVFARMGWRRERELTSRSNERRAKAELARAQLEGKLSSRRLSSDQSTKLSDALRLVGHRVPIIQFLRLQEVEAYDFATDIILAAQRAGITPHTVEVKHLPMQSGLKVVDTADGALAEALSAIDLGPVDYAVNNSVPPSILVGVKPPIVFKDALGQPTT